MKSNIICFITLWFFISITTAANNRIDQSNSQKPEVGKAMPDFKLNNITHFTETTASLKDFKGKWLFLDFWFPACVSCVQSFSKVNEFHIEFKKDLTWMMIGLNDTKYNKGVQQFYEKMRKRRNLEMPVAYDSTLAAQWGIYSMPHIIIIDPSGIVRFITDGRDMKREKIKSLLDGNAVSFFPKTDASKPNFDASKVTGTQNDSIDDKILFRSVLTEWNGEKQNGGVEIERWVTWPDNYLKQGYTLSMVPLYALYNYAYTGRWTWDCTVDSLYGKVYPRPVLELSDDSLFKYSFGKGDGGISGMYNYNLTIPSSEVTKQTIMALMQDDLKRFFKYNVTIETRSMPVWKLIAKPGAIDRLASKGANRFATPGSHATGFTVLNWPSKYLIGFVTFYLREQFQEPFVDETGLTKNLDLTLDADMTNIDAVRKAIQKQGLDLVKGMKEMKVIVIRDSK